MREAIKAYEMEGGVMCCLTSEVRALEKDYLNLERKLKIAEDKLELIKDINERYLTDDDDDPSNHIDRLASEALSAIREG